MDGWVDGIPAMVSIRKDKDVYLHEVFDKRTFLMKPQTECRDPTWMESNTYYPKGVLCYQIPNEEGCFNFGLSGSPLVRRFLDENGNTRFSWVGSLSMNKGCDKMPRWGSAYLTRFNVTYIIAHPRAENP